MTTGVAAAAAGDGFFRGGHEGCIAGHDAGSRQRPYHRNCSCALHKRQGDCHHLSPKSRVFYPMRRAWSESCLSLMAAGGSGQSSPSSPAPATGVLAGRASNLLKVDEDK